MQQQDINPRFPHWLKVTRMIVDDSVNPPTSVTQTIHEGECRNFPSRTGGTGITEGIFVSDYTISLPFNEIEFQINDLTEVTDRVRIFTGVIVNSYNGNLGCMIWHNKVNN